MIVPLTQAPGASLRQSFLHRAVASVVAILLLLTAVSASHAGDSGKETPVDLKPEPAWHPFSASVETAALFGVNNSNDYQTLPQIISLRYQRHPPEQFFHTPLSFSQEWALSAVIVPFTHGLENHYFGIGLGPRLIFGLPDRRFSIYVDGRFVCGAIDSTGLPGGQGQDFTFSALSSLGVLYQMNAHTKLGAAFFYEHFSNGGLSEPEHPNVGLDTVGPSLSLSYSF